MKQKKMILGVGAFLASCAFGGMSTSCTSECLLQEPVENTQGAMGKVPVVLDIKGLGNSSTRAGEDTPDSYQAAFDYEKEIKSLYAVVFNYDTNELYKVITVKNIDGSENKLPYFDLGNTGHYRIFFVANPGENLLGQITKGLTADADGIYVPDTDDSTAHLANPDALKALKQENEAGAGADDSRVGTGKKGGVTDGFLMIENNKEGKEVTPVANGVTPITITLQRAAARFDVLNNVPDLAVTEVKFDNYPASTYLFEPTEQNTVAVKSTGTYSLTAYGDHGLLGNNVAPGADGGGYVGDLYCYEWINGYSDDNAPKITLKYLEKKTDDNWSDAITGEITISFIKFAKDADGNFKLWKDLTDTEKTPYNALAAGTTPEDLWRGLVPELNDEQNALVYIPIQRNHLYRIRVVKTEDINNPVVAAVIEVADWNEGSQLGGTMVNDANYWQDRVRSLYGYRFMPMAMVNALNRANGTLTLSEDGSQSEVTFPTDYIEGQTFKIGNYDNNADARKLFADLRDGTMADASFIVPSSDDLAAVFPMAAHYDNWTIRKTYTGEYTQLFTNGGVFGDITEDHAYLHHDVGYDDVPLWMVRFVGTDQCALYKYSLAGNKVFIEIWPLTKDAKLVSEKGEFTFDGSSVAKDQFSFKDKDGVEKNLDTWSDETNDIMGLKQLSSDTKTNFNVHTSTIDKEQLIFVFDLSSYLYIGTSTFDNNNNRQALIISKDAWPSLILSRDVQSEHNPALIMRTISNQPKK